MMDIALSNANPAGFEGDALIVGVVGNSDALALATASELPSEVVEHLTSALDALDADASVGSIHRIPGVPGVTAKLVAVAGLGVEADPSSLRIAAANAAHALRGKDSLVFALPAASQADLDAILDGALGGMYEYGEEPACTHLTVLGAAAAASGAAERVARARTIAGARDWTRTLVNTPPNLLVPETFAAAVVDTSAESRAEVQVSVRDEAALADEGFGGIVGVGQGSAHPPRLVTMTYAPAKPVATVALVGKGITFDSGGLSLKPAKSMLTMKSDMAGAAAVAAAVLAIAELELPVRVVGYLAMAENLPGGNAQRPGDVVTMRGGTTVEVLNTDAEGRMVLGDAIALAAESEPDLIIDIATLTGAQIVALGPDIAGLMGRGDAAVGLVQAASEATGEAVWAMPLPDELRAKLDSSVADLAHWSSGGDAGMLLAAYFLGEFVPQETPWAHVDIAGPSFQESRRGANPKGGTGFGAALLIRVVEELAAKGGLRD